MAENTFDCNTGADAWSCLTVVDQGTVTVRGNAIHGGSHGLQAEGALARVLLQGNEVSGQTSHNLLLKRNDVVSGAGNDFRKSPQWEDYLVRCEGYTGDEPLVLDLEGNYWGYTSTYALDVDIWDHADDAADAVVVDYIPFATGSVPAATTGWGALQAGIRGQ